MWPLHPHQPKIILIPKQDGRKEKEMERWSLTKYVNKKIKKNHTSPPKDESCLFFLLCCVSSPSRFHLFFSTLHIFFLKTPPLFLIFVVVVFSNSNGMNLPWMVSSNSFKILWLPWTSNEYLPNLKSQSPCCEYPKNPLNLKDQSPKPSNLCLPKESYSTSNLNVLMSLLFS